MRLTNPRTGELGPEFNPLIEQSADFYREYLPDIPAAYLMYDIKIKTGTKPIDAALEVMAACIKAAQPRGRK